MKTGEIKIFNEQKGFGFIREDGTNQEFFVHVTGLVDEVKAGDRVSFEVQEGRKGINAVNVRLM